MSRQEYDVGRNVGFVKAPSGTKYDPVFFLQLISFLQTSGADGTFEQLVKKNFNKGHDGAMVHNE
jgi:hypothetical protein